MEKTKGRGTKSLLLAAVAVLFAIIFQTAISHAATGINQQVSFQGKLVNTNGTNLPDGVYNLQFKIYQDGTGCIASGTAPCGGTLKWTESRLVSATQGVTVTAGTFQVNLGSITAFGASVDWNQDTLWLSMNVGGTATTPVWDGEMTPFIRLTSVPYSLNAGMVGGLTASQLVQLTPASTQTGTIDVSGNIKSGSTLQVNTLDSATSGVLTVGSTNSTSITLAENTSVTGSVTIQGAVNTSAFGPPTLTVDNGATSTQNIIALALGGTTRSTIRFDSLGNLIMSGTVAGALFLNNDGGSGGVYIGSATNINTLFNYGSYTQSGTSANTLSGATQIGSGTTDATLVDLQVDSFNAVSDSGTACTTTSNQGAMYYNSASGTMRACVNGSWEDLVSTGGLGLLAFGVIPDSANATSVGEIAGITPSNSPCKVYWSAATAVTVAPCTAYSGGRKVIVPSTVLSTVGIASTAYTNVCLDGANGAPALSGTASTTETSASRPAWSANNPILCLATLQIGATAGNITNGKIYDIRTFTTTQKTYATSNTAVNVGFAVVQAGANLIGTAVTAVGNVRGVVVAYSGTPGTTTANVILATAGPQWVKAVGTSTAAQDVTLTTTAGYTASVVNATTAVAYYNMLGVATRTIDTGCTSATTCQYSQFLNPLNIR
jgi:hypothetical protein